MVASLATDARPRADRHALTVVLTVIAGTVMIPLDVTVVAVALTRLSEETGASLPVIQWVSTGYTLAVAAGIPTAAWAIGRYGGRRVFLTALTVFTTGSLLVALSWDAPSLITFRVLQGLGGGFVMPAAMTLTLRAAPPEQRGRVMALLGLPILVGPVFGPPLGGVLTDHLSWRWIFLVNLPIGIAAVLLGRRNLPTAPGDRSTVLDRRGMLLLPPAMVLLVVGTSRLEDSLLEPSALVPIVAALVLLAAFARHALRVAAPLLKVRLLGRRLTGGGALVLVLFVGAYFSTLLLVPLYFQVARGETATTTGLLMMPQAIAAGISIQVSGRLIDRVPPLRVIGTGIAMATLGYATFAWQLTEGTPYGLLVASLVLGAAGAGGCMLPTMTLATRYLDDPDIPSGSTIITVLNQLAASLVTAAVSVALAAGLTARLPELDGGVGDLQHLPAADHLAAAPLLAEAVQVTFLLPVGLMTAAFVVAVVVLRRRPDRL
jgi:EmrB/QacA subfamily drug resistance transporter